MSDPIITRQFEVDRDDYCRALWARGLGRRLIIAAAICVAICLIEFSISDLMALASALTLVTLLPLLAGIRWMMARHNVRNPKNSSSFEAKTMEFTDIGFHLRTKGGVESSVPWTYILHAERRAVFTLLFSGSILHYAIPDSAFTTADERQRFFRLLSSLGKWEGKPPVE